MLRFIGIPPRCVQPTMGVVVSRFPLPVFVPPLLPSHGNVAPELTLYDSVWDPAPTILPISFGVRTRKARCWALALGAVLGVRRWDRAVTGCASTNDHPKTPAKPSAILRAHGGL